MIEIKLEEASSLTLEMEIEGEVKNEAAELRFSVISEGMRYSFPGREVSKGVYAIDFPEMLGKITEGEYKADVEIIVDGRHFTPLTETVKFTKELKPVVKMNESAPAPSPTVAVGVKLGKVETAPPAPEVKQAQISDVKGIVTHLVESIDGGHTISTVNALRSLNHLVEGTTASITESVMVAPVGKAGEAEVLATLKMIGRHGTDITESIDVSAIMAISERVRENARQLFLDKGMSARDLQQYL